jgi:hypothetical protein
MTIERWTDERLDRLAAIVESNTGAIASSDIRLTRLEESMQTMIIAVERVTNLQMETFAIVREMQAEVRGLQTENRRILDRVFGDA